MTRTVFRLSSQLEISFTKECAVYKCVGGGEERFGIVLGDIPSSRRRRKAPRRLNDEVSIDKCINREIHVDP